MVAASDTSPISNLALVARLELLRFQFGDVWILDAVKRELSRLRSPEERASIEQAMQAGWLRCWDIADPPLAAVVASDLEAKQKPSQLATEFRQMCS
jgi:predicted nucleic acid-binding protein